MIRRSLLLALACACISCGGDTDPVPVASISLNSGDVQILVGDSVQLSATLQDASGNTLTDRSPSWSSTNEAVASVSSTGKVLALSSGTANITAAADDKTASLKATILGPVATVTLNFPAVQLAKGDSTQLAVTLKDASGSTLSGRQIDWTTDDNAVATVTSTGKVHAVDVGVAHITATSESKSASSQITVVLAPSPQTVTPALLLAGGSAVITGANFSPTIAENSVTIDGVDATITAATPTQLDITIPPASAFTCAPTHDADLVISVNGSSGSIQHPIQIATQRSMAVGETLLLTSAAESRCNELSQTGGRYVMTVSRPDQGITTTTSFRLRGAASTVSPKPAIPAVTAAARLVSPQRPGAGILSPFDMVNASRRRANARRHLGVLDQNIQFATANLSKIRSRMSSGALRRPSPGAAFSAIGTVGDTTTLKIPNINSSNLCTSTPATVQARTVYSGTRAIVLEDIAAPLAGTMDSYYQALGQEFDNAMYPIIKNNFADPLAFDAQLDNNGKILMLFSEDVNDFGGILGFVASCDFFPISAAPASNEAEIFYAVVPDDARTGFPNQTTNAMTRDQWRRVMRSTVIHEVKHVAMFANRVSNPSAQSFEESWLEEGMAQLAEELYSRTITGATWRGNTAYGSSSDPNNFYCEVRPSFSACTDRPFIMTAHLAFLYDFLRDVENKSVLGGYPNSSSDPSFYGSAWLLTRFLLDSYGTDEATLLQALTTEPSLTGTANLEARTGVPYETFLAQYHIALQLDDDPNFTPTQPWQQISSWDLPAIYFGLSDDFGDLFVQSPLLKHIVVFGGFTVNIAGLRGGTAAHFDLSGTQSGKQMIALESASGAAPDAGLRLSVIRVQ